MSILLHLAVLTVVILALAKLHPDVRVRGIGSAVAVAVVFSVLNVLLGWFIRAVLFVPALLTFGLLFLFLPFIVNAVLLWLTDRIMSSFEIRTGRALALAALVITLVDAVFHSRILAAAWSPHGYGPPRWI